MRRDYGEWITAYTDPQPHRYHAGLKAGQLSQAGWILRLMLNSLSDCGGYDEADFCRRLEEELFPELDGTPVSGPGGYTSQSIREAWRRRVQQHLPWTETGGHADTTEAIDLYLILSESVASFFAWFSPFLQNGQRLFGRKVASTGKSLILWAIPVK